MSRPGTAAGRLRKHRAAGSVSLSLGGESRAGAGVAAPDQDVRNSPRTRAQGQQGDEFLRAAGVYFVPHRRRMRELPEVVEQFSGVIDSASMPQIADAICLNALVRYPPDA